MRKRLRNLKFLGKNRYELVASVPLLMGAAFCSCVDILSFPLTLMAWAFYWLAFFCAANALEDREEMGQVEYWFARLWMCSLLIILFGSMIFPVTMRD